MYLTAHVWMIMKTPPHALLFYLPPCTTWIVCVEVCPPALHDTLSPFISVSALKLSVVAALLKLLQENMNPDACKDLLVPTGSRNTNPEITTPL